MEKHLAAGCRRCSATLNLLQRVLAITRAESRYEPPEYAIQWAKAIYPLSQPRKSAATRLLARLVFDSFLEPLPAGMRAGDRVSRQVLYEAGDYYLDLRFEHEKTDPLVTLVGQLTNRKDPESFSAELPVLVVTRRDVVGHAVCNEFGEFQVEFAPSRPVRLHISLGPTGPHLEVPLSRLVAEPVPASGVVSLRRLRRKPARRRRN